MNVEESKEFLGSEVPEDALNPIESSRVFGPKKVKNGKSECGRTIKRTVDYSARDDKNRRQVYFSTDNSKKQMKGKTFCSCCGGRYCLSGIDPRPYGIRGTTRTTKKHFQKKDIEEDLQEYKNSCTFQEQTKQLLSSKGLNSEVYSWPEQEWTSFWDHVYGEEGYPEEMHEEVSSEDDISFEPIFFQSSFEAAEEIRFRRMEAKRIHKEKCITAPARREARHYARLAALAAKYSAKLKILANKIKKYANVASQELMEKNKLCWDQAFKGLENDESAMKSYYVSEYEKFSNLLNNITSRY